MTGQIAPSPTGPILGEDMGSVCPEFTALGD